jgi:hypothetical protein
MKPGAAPLAPCFFRDFVRAVLGRLRPDFHNGSIVTGVGVCSPDDPCRRLAMSGSIKNKQTDGPQATFSFFSFLVLFFRFPFSM